MTNKPTEYKPNIAIPPGETLEELLDSLGMAPVELAGKLAISMDDVMQIINGKAPITPEIALKLEGIFKTPATFWNNLEANYRETKTRLEEEKRTRNQISAVAESPTLYQ